MRFRLAHGNPVGSQLRFDLISFGTEGLDDPGDIGEAELIAMTPPYAFIGGGPAYNHVQAQGVMLGTSVKW